VNKTQQQIGAMAQAGKAAVHPLPYFRHAGRGSILQTLFDIAVTEFFWIEFGRIGRQPLDDDCGVLCQVGLGLVTGVDARSIPYENEPPSNVSLQMLEGLDRVCAVYAAVAMALVNLARPSQADRRRQSAALAGHAAHPRAPAGQRPSAPQGFLKREAKLIEKHDFGAVSPRLFLSGASPAPTRLGSPLRRVQSPAAKELVD